MIIEGNILDVRNGRVFPGKVLIKNKKIVDVIENNKTYNSFILPGLIDAHIHIESSMMCPSRLAEAVVPHGTTSLIVDPHEIANVAGLDGINYMMKDAAITPSKIFFTAPSCVPATSFETSGADIDSKSIEKLMKLRNVVALGEMMNYHGVIFGDKAVIEKIDIAKKFNKPIDGHCPGLTGDDLKKYVSYGITTDHECTSLKEAEEKAALGMKIMIREGSSAKNMEELIKLEQKESFFVSDDKHVEDLEKGHMDAILRKAVSLGMNAIEAVKKVTINPAEHYRLETGVIEKGMPADIVQVKDLKNFFVEKVIIDGKIVAVNGKPLFKVKPKKFPLKIKTKPVKENDFDVICKNRKTVKVRVIEVVEHQIITKQAIEELPVIDEKIQVDLEKDVLKIAVIDRYGKGNVSVGFVKGFGLKKGAIASSVAHDSHNIIVVGTNNQDMKNVVDIVSKYGGLVVVCGKTPMKIELSIAGLMSNDSADTVKDKLKKIHEFVKTLGCKLESPFTTLSFLALLVIPELKISDKGLFDSRNFKFVNVIV